MRRRFIPAAESLSSRRLCDAGLAHTILQGAWDHGFRYYDVYENAPAYPETPDPVLAGGLGPAPADLGPATPELDEGAPALADGVLLIWFADDPE